MTEEILYWVRSLCLALVYAGSKSSYASPTHPLLARCLCPGIVGSFLLVGDHTIVKYITVESVFNQ